MCGFTQVIILNIHNYVMNLALFLSLVQASLGVHTVKCLPAMQETWVRSLGQEDPLEKYPL